MDMKFCKKCAIHKPLREYRLHKTAKDGHRNICKSCMNTIANLKYATDLEWRAKRIKNSTKTKANSSNEEWESHLKRNRNYYRNIIKDPMTKEVYSQKKLLEDKLSREDLKTKYIKRLLVSKTDLEFNDIPESLVMLKRKQLKLYRNVKENRN